IPLGSSRPVTNGTALPFSMTMTAPSPSLSNSPIVVTNILLLGGNPKPPGPKPGPGGANPEPGALVPGPRQTDSGFTSPVTIGLGNGCWAMAVGMIARVRASARESEWFIARDPQRFKREGGGVSVTGVGVEC